MKPVVLVTLLAIALAGLAGCQTPRLETGAEAAARGDYAAAIREWRPHAERGDAPSQYRLGALYAKGMGVSLDSKEAAKWYRQAAEQGYADAQYALGGLYAEGAGVEADYAAAAEWYRRASTQGQDRKSVV